MPLTSRSTLEERVQLNLKNRGVAYEYEPCKLPYTVTRNYTPDLKIGETYIEVKGYFRQDAQRKMRNMKEQHPELDIRCVFSNSNSKLYKGAKSTYADWCTKHGFMYADKRIPDEWLKKQSS